MAGPPPRAPAASSLPPRESRVPAPIKSSKTLHRVSTPALSRNRARSWVGRLSRRSGRKEWGAMMRPVSHPLVHPDPDPAAVDAAAPAPAPVEAAAPAPAPAPAPAAAAPAQGQAEGANAVNAPPAGVQMRAPSPRARLGLRVAQALLAAAALAAMASARDFASVTAFRYLVSASALQCMWSLALAILYLYALLVGRSFRSPRAAAILGVGDWITGTLTFSAACASAGITVFINNDVGFCFGNHCPSYMSATAMAFLSWFAIVPCCLYSLSAVVYKLQRP